MIKLVIFFYQNAISQTFTLINIRKIKTDLDNDLHLEKTNMHHVVILIKSVFNENHKQYYFRVFSGKCLYK